MKRRTLVLGGLLLVGLAFGGGFFAGVSSAPPVYLAIIAQKTATELDEDRRQFESQLALVYNDAQRAAPWAVRISDAEVNGWLATQVPLDYPELAERGLRDVRVMFGEQSAQVAVRSKLMGLESVLSISGNVFTTDHGELAIELTSAAAGRIALPLRLIVPQVEEIIRQQDLPLHWAPSESRHILLVDFERLASSSDLLRRLTAVELRAGHLAIAGVTAEVKQPQFEAKR